MRAPCLRRRPLHERRGQDDWRTPLHLLRRLLRLRRLRLPVGGSRLRVFAGSAIGFDNGDADFSRYGILGRLQVIKKGMVCMRVVVYAIREADSVGGNAAALHA